MFLSFHLFINIHDVWGPREFRQNNSWNSSSLFILNSTMTFQCCEKEWNHHKVVLLVEKSTQISLDHCYSLTSPKLQKIPGKVALMSPRKATAQAGPSRLHSKTSIHHSQAFVWCCFCYFCKHVGHLFPEPQKCIRLIKKKKKRTERLEWTWTGWTCSTQVFKVLSGQARASRHPSFILLNNGNHSWNSHWYNNWTQSWLNTTARNIPVQQVDTSLYWT